MSDRLSLDSPETECYVECRDVTGYSFAAVSRQGWREIQEDRFLCSTHFYEGYGFFGVYDGHGGSEVAECLKGRLHSHIKEIFGEKNDMKITLEISFPTVDKLLRNARQVFERERNCSTRNRMIWDENRGPLEDECRELLNDLITTIEKVDDVMTILEKFDDEIPIKEKIDDAITIMGKLEDVITTIENVPEKQNPSQVVAPLDVLLSSKMGPSDSDDEDIVIEDDYSSVLQIRAENETEKDPIEEFRKVIYLKKKEDCKYAAKTKIRNIQPYYYSGSSATVVLIGRNKVFVANVGDTRCVVSRNGKAVDLSVDHNVSNPGEKARVIGAGASVSEDGRIGNDLIVTRAFGSFKYKNEFLETSQSIINVVPHVSEMDLTNNEDFLIIATQGIWHHMSSQEVVDHVTRRLDEGKLQLKDICKEIMDRAVAKEEDVTGIGCGNMTCILIKFHTVA